MYISDSNAIEGWLRWFEATKDAKGVDVKEVWPSRNRELSMSNLLCIRYISDAVLRSRPASIRLGLAIIPMWALWEDLEI